MLKQITVSVLAVAIAAGVEAFEERPDRGREVLGPIMMDIADVTLD